MKCKILFFAVAISMLFTGIVISAEEDIFYLVEYGNNKKEVIDEFSSFSSAYRYFRNVKDEYDNLAIVSDDNVLLMEYGVVEFKTDDSCAYTVEYEDINNGKQSNLNGCYAIDGAYISTSSNSRDVTFKVAGAYGKTSIENVILHPIDSLDMRLSSYIVVDGILYHEVKTQLVQDFYSTSISLGEAPEYLEESIGYFSYDGHYFYNDFKAMIDDYNNEETVRAINADSPYYNYYQYLPHRTITNYSYEEIRTYFDEILCFDRKLQKYEDFNVDNANDVVNQSQYYGELQSFFEYQNIYGANALMMLSISMNESSYGKSLNSFVNNNLFAHAAFDNEEERNASRYSDLEKSVYSHAKYYISSRFANHLSSVYNGSFFGNKASGMNIQYSNDPYWGEKAASNYYTLDKTLGSKDDNAYALGLIYYANSLPVYRDSSLSETKMTLRNISDFSFVILEENDNYYKVQLDSSNDSDNYTYNFNECVGYIEKNDIDVIINKDEILNREYVTITIDANGGKINNFDEVSFNVLKGQKPYINSIDRDGYKWVTFDSELEDANADKKYVAEYIKIDSVELVGFKEKIVEKGEPYIFDGYKIKVYYENGSSEVLDVNSNMISNFNTNEEGLISVQINYCGVTTSFDITVSNELNTIRDELNNKISENIETFNQNGTYNINDLDFIKESLTKIDYQLSFEEIRALDAMMIQNSDNNYHILDNDFDMSISGFALSLPDAENDDFIVPNTYYAKVSKVTRRKTRRLIDVSKAYGFKDVSSFNLKFSLNLKDIDPIIPFVVQVKIDDKDLNSIYSVYRLDVDGNVYKCRSRQSTNYIQFLTNGSGDFMILSMNSQNTYDLQDGIENINADNQDINIHKLFIEYSFLFMISLVAVILLINLKRLVKEQNDLWKDYKKLSLNVECVQEEGQKN